MDEKIVGILTVFILINDFKQDDVVTHCTNTREHSRRDYRQMVLFENLPDAILQQIAEFSPPPSVSDPVVRSRQVVYTDLGDDKPFNKTSTMRDLPQTIQLSSGSVACYLPSMEPTFGDPDPWEEHFLFNPTKSFHSVVTPNNNDQYIVVGTLVNGKLYRFGGLSKLAKRFTNTISSINCIMHSEIEIEGPNENTSSSVMMYIK